MKHNNYCQLQVGLVRRPMYGSKSSNWLKQNEVNSWIKTHPNVKCARRVVDVAAQDQTRVEKRASPKWVIELTKHFMFFFFFYLYLWGNLAGLSPPPAVPCSQRPFSNRPVINVWSGHPLDLTPRCLNEWPKNAKYHRGEVWQSCMPCNKCNLG